MRFLLIRAVLSVRPNGSRLSCGASAGGRKRPVLRYRQAGAQTFASSESRPRQLQALVRRQTHTRGLSLCGGAACRELEKVTVGITDEHISLAPLTLRRTVDLDLQA